MNARARQHSPQVTIAPRPPLAAFGAVALLLFSFVAQAQDTTGVGAVIGVITDVDGRPVPHARVCALGTVRCAITDAAGQFRLLDLRAGRYRLRIFAPNRPSSFSPDLDVHAGVESILKLSLPTLAAVTIMATTQSLPEEIKTSGFLVQPEAIRNTAGALQDVSRYLRSLPGVVMGREEERNDLIVRGGSPLENLFIVDNVQVPNINSFANFASGGGLVGMVDPALLRDVTFITGGYPASYANRLSSVLQIDLREGPHERCEGTATAGFAGAGVVLGCPFDQSNGSWILSVRRTFLDLLTNDIGAGGVPVSYYVNFKALYDFSPRDRVWLVNLSDIDSIHIGLHGRSLDDATVISEEIEQDISSRSARLATGINWQHTFGERTVGLLGISYSSARPDFTVGDLLKPGLPLVYADHSQENETTLKYDLAVEKVPLLGTVQSGASIGQFRLNYQVVSPSGQDNPYSPTPDANPFELHDAFSAYQAGYYVQATRNFGSKLGVTIGERFDDYRYIGHRRTSPRAAVSYQLSAPLAWTASYGRYFQQLPFLLLSAFPENRRLPPLGATHFVTGLAYTPSARSKLSVELYRKDYRDYPVSSQFATLSLANLGDTFDESESLMPLLGAGHGVAEGLEVLAANHSKTWNTQLSVAWSRARQAGLDGVLRPSSFDSPLVVNLLAERRIRQKWNISGRFTYLAGRPYTPFDEELSQEQGRGIFDLARVNALRAPAYARIDLRIDRTWTVWNEPLTAFLDVQNVTDRHNPLIYTWNQITNEPMALNQEGLFPFLGFSWRFY